METASSSRAQRPGADDGESRARIGLPEQRDAVDLELPKAKPGKARAQHRQQLLAPRLAEPAGQRHMEAVFLHDVRVAPAVKIFDLPRRELVRIAPRAVLC